MWYRVLFVAVLAAIVEAQQTPNLLAALNSTSNLSTLQSLLNSHPAVAAVLADATNITVLAPNNDAIATFMNSSRNADDPETIRAILRYHVLRGTYQNFTTAPQFIPTFLMPGMYARVSGGQRVQLNTDTVTSGYKHVSNITSQTVNFTGGVIHVIDRVLTVPTDFTANLRAFNLTAALGVVRELDATRVVDNSPDWTGFIPTNRGFDNIGSILSNLSMRELAGIVGYHIVNTSALYTTDLRNQSYGTFAGQNLTITKYNESAVFVNGARIVIPNILVANGVLHIVDELINPNNQSARASGPTGQPAFSGASSATSNPFTSGIPGPTSSLNTASIQSTATAAATRASTSISSSSPSSTSIGAAWLPRATGAVQAALAGGLALVFV